jgi:hypothetical protein
MPLPAHQSRRAPVALVGLLVIAMIAFPVGTALAQAASRDAPRRSWFLLYEVALGGPLNPSGASSGTTYLGADLGPMVRRGNRAWGGSVFGAGTPCDGLECVRRVGLRGRYRRWLGPKTTLDVGLGPVVVSGGAGAAGVVSLASGDLAGVTLHWELVSGGPTLETAPVGRVFVGFRIGGVPAAVLTGGMAVLAVVEMEREWH